MGKKKDIPLTTRIEILKHLHSLAQENILPYGSIASTARKFDVSKSAVYQIWNTKGLKTRRKGKSAVKLSGQTNSFTMVKNVDLENRCTFKSLSHASGVPKTTLHKKVKLELLNPFNTNFL